MRKLYIALSVIILCSLSSKAQIDPSTIIIGTKADINYLADGYLKPVGISLATGLGNGWYNSAETHKAGRFEINFSMGVVAIPSSDQSFIIDNDKLDQLELVDPNDNVAPTAFGENNPGPRLRYKNGAGPNFNTPPGIGFAYLPLLNIGAEVGIGINTDISLRFFPNSGIPGVKGSEFGMFGFGFNHEFLKWLPHGDKLPINASIMFGYASQTYNQELDSSSTENMMTLKSTGYTIRGVVSKEIAFLTLYGGIGYNSGRTKMDIKGTYTYENMFGSETSIEDPYSSTVDASGMTGNVGVCLEFLWILSFNADYTFGNYNSFTMGLGAGIEF